MKIPENVIPLPEFEKDLKKLSKRFRTIEEDLGVFINNELLLYHQLKIDNQGIFQIQGLLKENPPVFKAKKFACRSLKGRGVHSGIRVIYAYFEKEKRIVLIEIYFKGDKKNEDGERIKGFLLKCST